MKIRRHFPAVGLIGPALLIASGIDLTQSQTFDIAIPDGHRFLPQLGTIVNQTAISVSAGAALTLDTYRAAAISSAVRAALSTSLTGSNNDLDFKAVDPGTAGNGIRIAYVDPADVNTAEIVRVTNDATGPLITVTLKQTASGGTRATLSTNLTGNNNDLTFTSTVQTTTGNSTTIAYVDPAGNNAVLSVSVTGSAITVNLATGVAGAITSTAAQIKTALDASVPAAALITTANKAANDGTGVVTAMTATALAGGITGSITSTGATVKAAIQADPQASALVYVANKSGNDGTGIVTAMSATALTSGATGSAGADTSHIVNAATLSSSATDGLTETLTLLPLRVIEAGAGVLRVTIVGSTAFAQLADLVISGQSV